MAQLFNVALMLAMKFSDYELLFTYFRVVVQPVVENMHIVSVSPIVVMYASI